MLKVISILMAVSIYALFSLIGIVMDAIPAHGQTAPFVYNKNLGESVTFAWDHTPFQLSCIPTGTTTPVLTTIPRGQATTFTCNGRNYPVTWNSTGDTATVAGFNSDGSNYVAAMSYRYQAFKIGPPETAGPTGSQVGNQKTFPLDFGLGDVRLEVQAVHRIGTNESVSAWAKSTDPAYATVDGTGRGWIVRVNVPPPPPPPAPGEVRNMRVIP